MSRPPKKIDEPFFDGKKILLSCLQGCSILVIVLAIYFIFLKIGYNEKEVRAMSFLTLIVSNIAIILSNRSWSRNILQILATRNKTVKWIVVGAVVFLVLILNIPFLMDLFQFEKIKFINVLICIGAGLLSITWFEVYKLVKREA